MIEVYKLLMGKEQIDYEQFFRLAANHYGIRGHEKKLTKDRSKMDTKKFFFSKRVVNRWNSLSAEVVNAESMKLNQQLQKCLRPLGALAIKIWTACQSINIQVRVWFDASS